jgi:hypothetical protein
MSKTFHGGIENVRGGPKETENGKEVKIGTPSTINEKEFRDCGCLVMVKLLLLLFYVIK